jgi:hypothetical protein
VDPEIMNTLEPTTK